MTGRARTAVRFDFERLTRWHWIAAAASLALLFVMAVDWYGTRLADSLRRDERLAVTGGVLSGEPGRALKREIPMVAEPLEQNAWQAYWGLDLGILVLLLLLAAVAAGLLAAYARAADVGSVRSVPPSALAAGAGVLAILAVVLRLIEQPGLDEATTVRGGAPLGLLCLGVLVLAASRAMRAEASSAAGPSPTPGAAPPAAGPPGAAPPAAPAPRVR